MNAKQDIHSHIDNSNVIFQHPEQYPSMGVYEAWEMGYSGAGVNIAVLDDGVDIGHPDLIDNYVTLYSSTVKSVLSGHSIIDKTKILPTNGSSMKVKSIAECSNESILQYFYLN